MFCNCTYLRIINVFNSVSFASDLTSLARSAASHQVVLQVCLWSFDMCKNSEFPGQTLRTGLIADAAKTASYVENALKPLLAALKPPAVAAGAVLVEVINEPEWCMKGPGNTDVTVEPAQMQRSTPSLPMCRARSSVEQPHARWKAAESS